MKPAVPVSKTVSYCAPLRFHPNTRNTGARWGPRRCAQACGARKGYLLSLPSIYEPVCAQEPRPHWLDMLGYYLSPLSGLVLRQSKGLTRTFNYTPTYITNPETGETQGQDPGTDALNVHSGKVRREQDLRQPGDK